MIKNILQRISPQKGLKSKCDSALLSAVLNPRFHKAQEQLTSRFLNAYVRYMFDSVNLAKEISTIRAEGYELVNSALRSTVSIENEEFKKTDSPYYKAMVETLRARTQEASNEAMQEAKRKSHQFSQLSQSVLKDQRNNLMLSKTILMAQRNGQDGVIEELSMIQLGISPADAFASKLLEDSDMLDNADNIDLLCYASLAEGIRSVANSQMNHFFQMRRFEKERNINSFNGISSDEIIEQLELDVSLVLKYDSLIELEQKVTSQAHRSDLHLSDINLPNLH